MAMATRDDGDGDDDADDDGDDEDDDGMIAASNSSSSRSNSSSSRPQLHPYLHSQFVQRRQPCAGLGSRRLPFTLEQG